MILPFESNSYHTIYVDPPWPEFGGGKITRGAQRHYQLLRLPEIMAFAPEISRVAKNDAHLYIWVTNNYLPGGLELLKLSGFRYITMVTWSKLGNWGLGQYFRGRTEHCLFGVRGRLPYRTKPDGKRAQGSTLIEASRREHSEKPEEMRALIEQVSYPPYLELFARKEYLGWTTWGNELGGSIG